MMTKRLFIRKACLLIILIVSAVVIAVFSADCAGYAFAASREKVLEVKQESILYYCGQNYLYNDTYKNALLQAVSVEFDGEKFDATAQNTTITSSKKISDPGAYQCTFTVFDGEKNYTVENVNIRVSKREVAVTVYLNGKTELTIYEGDNVYVAYDYDGAIEGDYSTETVNGVVVRTIHSSAMDSVAYLEYLPTTVIQNYTVAAAHASSKYYTFVYRKSVLNIIEKTVSELSFSSDDKVLVSLFGGEFGSSSELSFVNVGTSETSPQYAEIKQRIDTEYDTSAIKNDYKQIACYTIDVNVNNVQKENVSCNVFVLLDDSAKGKNSYKVIAFYNNGSTEVLNARTINDEYLVFSTKDMGEFVVVTPVQGVKISTYIIVISVAVAFVFLIILLVALFRRKF